MHDAVNLITMKHRTYLLPRGRAPARSAEQRRLAPPTMVLVSLFASQIEGRSHRLAHPRGENGRPRRIPGIQVATGLATAIPLGAPHSLERRGPCSRLRRRAAAGQASGWRFHDTAPRSLPGWGQCHAVGLAQQLRNLRAPPSLAQRAAGARLQRSQAVRIADSARWRAPAEQTEIRMFCMLSPSVILGERRRADDRRSSPRRVGHGARPGDDLSRSVRCGCHVPGGQYTFNFWRPNTRSQWRSRWQRGDGWLFGLDAALSTPPHPDYHRATPPTGTPWRQCWSSSSATILAGRSSRPARPTRALVLSGGR